MKRGGGLRRGAPLRRTRMRESSVARERRQEHADTIGPLRLAVFVRDGWACVRCGATSPLEAHHRLPRGAGGGDTAANLVTLCGPNPAGCHGKVHGSPRDVGYPTGLLLRASDGPPSEPWAGIAGR